VEASQAAKPLTVYDLKLIASSAYVEHIAEIGDTCCGDTGASLGDRRVFTKKIHLAVLIIPINLIDNIEKDRT
jgi:hypothetical protein